MTREESINKWIIPTIKNTWNEKKCKEILEALEQEPKTGRWVRDEDWHYHCDVCGAKAPWSWTDGDGFDRMVTPYCPQCGAEMEKWEDTDEEWYVHRDEVYGKGK